jgi:hypothetical protein
MGPNHFTLKEGGAVCSLCQTKNPLGNLRRMSIQEVTEPLEVLVCFTQGGTLAHALHIDCTTVLGPGSGSNPQRRWREPSSTWAPRKSSSRHAGARFGRLDREAAISDCCHRKNLLKIDWSKLGFDISAMKRFPPVAGAFCDVFSSAGHMGRTAQRTHFCSTERTKPCLGLKFKRK